MNTLLIYEEVPEKTRLYVIPSNTLTEEDIKALNTINGLYVNSTIDTSEEHLAADKVQAALTSLEHKEEARYFGPEVPKEWRCKWKQYEVDIEKGPIEQPIEKVYLTGFIM